MTPAARFLLEPPSGLDTVALFAGLCDRLIEAGVPLWRGFTSLYTLHPEVFVQDLRWIRGEGCRRTTQPHVLESSAQFQNSPLRVLKTGAPSVRCRIGGPPEALPYPVLRDLAAQGGTDYLALPLRFGDGHTSFVSFTTDAPAGFAPDAIALLEEVRPFLQLRFELEGANLATRSLLQVYLGQNAAQRVLSGSFRRGTGEALRAAILFCDLRGFTHFTDEHPVGEVVATLDRYFDAVACPIDQQGGEVLKFIGDALLAIFPGDDGAACRRALDAGRAALSAIDALSDERRAQGRPALAIGVALHHGEVMYGNIGACDRLDFTVIGRAINEASRVESLCKELKVSLLATGAFASLVGGQGLRSVGHHALRGVAAPQELFTAA